MRTYPTLAESLAVARSPGRPRLADCRLLLLVEADPASSAMRSTLASVVRAAPKGSHVGVLEGGVARVSPSARANTSVRSDWPAWDIRTLGGLRALLGELRSDVVHVEPPREVTTDALAALVSAALADSVCATVSDVRRADESASAAEGPLPCPGIDEPSWGLVLLRRDALLLGLDNVDAIDAGTATPTEEFTSLRGLLGRVIVGPGFVHRGLGGVPPLPAPPHSPRVAHRRTSTLNVAIDARQLTAPLSGTQTQFLSLLGALAQTGEVRLSALVPESIHPSLESLLERLDGSVDFTSQGKLEHVDVFHRPSQVGSLEDLVECFTFGRRFVLTQQDMILDRTPAYFPSREAWHAFHRATRGALQSADHVGFFSEHAALDAASDGLIDPERATVVPLGVDHVDVEGHAEVPEELGPLADRPFLLMVGTTLRHKNRVFALRLLRELVGERGWPGSLVIAGPSYPWGGSEQDEQRLLARDAALRERVVDLGAVSESEKRGLYANAAVVLFPSLYEGFGFIPFEAAAFGTPCLYARRGPVAELLPADGALPADFSTAGTASRVLELCSNPLARDELVAAIRAAGRPLTWEATARGYLEVYRRALEDEPRGAIDRAILTAALATSDGIPLTPNEARVVRVYRRRRVFRKFAEAFIVAGGLTTRAARLGRPPTRDPGRASEAE
jgi:glycosyltransferase involved in cell wall biosynthesis